MQITVFWDRTDPRFLFTSDDWAVHDPIEKIEPIRQRGIREMTGYRRIIEDESIKDKRLMIHEGEFTSVLKMVNREGKTRSVIIRSA